MANIKDFYDLVNPGLIGDGSDSINGGGEIHVSGDVVINGIKIGDDLYEVNGYIVNGKGEIQGIK